MSRVESVSCCALQMTICTQHPSFVSHSDRYSTYPRAEHWGRTLGANSPVAIFFKWNFWTITGEYHYWRYSIRLTNCLSLRYLFVLFPHDPYGTFAKFDRTVPRLVSDILLRGRMEDSYFQEFNLDPLTGRSEG